MASGPRLAGERLGRFRALGVQGEPAWRQAGQIRAALIARLGQEHADVLAMPQVDESGERIDWYAPFEGAVAAAASMSPEERLELQSKADRLRDDIQALADRLGASGHSDAERNFARLLRHVLTTPGAAMLYAVAGRPVFAFWGFAGDGSLPARFVAQPARAAAVPAAAATAAEPPTVAAAASGGAVPPPAPAVVGSTAAADDRDGWKLALIALLLLFLLALGAWLIKPHLPMLLGLDEHGRRAAEIALIGEASAADDPSTAAKRQALAQASSRGAQLAGEFAALGGDLGRKQGQCTPGSIGRVIGPAGEVVIGDGTVVGRVANDGGRLVVIGPDGRPVVGSDGKPVDPKGVVDQAARDAPNARAGERVVGRGDEAPGKEGEKGQQGEKPGEQGKAGAQSEKGEKGEKGNADAAGREPLPPAERGAPGDRAATPGDRMATPGDRGPGDRGPGGRRANEPQQAAKPPTPPQQKIEKPLSVPADSRARGDVGFLKGDWRSSSTLTTQRGEEEVRINYQFDDKGKGKAMIVQNDGVTCEAPATARFDKDGKLLIEEQANAKCSDGSSYVKSTVTCEVGKETGADCTGRNDGGKTYSVQIGK
jgi:hypothetical protein